MERSKLLNKKERCEIMKISQNGINLVKRFEGCRLTAYKPVAAEKYWTIGYGHYGPDVQKGQKITQGKAEQLLKGDLVRYEDYVRRYVKFDMNQNQFDALVSFCYNCGAGSLQTLVRNRTPETVAQKMLAYNKGAGGVVLAGLTKRRQAERELFLRPVVAVKVEQEDDEMVEKSKIIVNGKEVPVKRILKDGTNFIAVRDVGDALGYAVSNKGNVPILTKR